jgi:predicted small integral membrane protein
MEAGLRLGKLVQSMYWTPPTAIFFATIALMLVAMTVLQLAYPTVERRGFLPMPTTRGDRLFVGLVGSAWIHLAWLMLTDLPLWWASVIAVVWFVAVMRFG